MPGPEAGRSLGIRETIGKGGAEQGGPEEGGEVHRAPILQAQAGGGKGSGLSHCKETSVSAECIC